MYSNLDDADHGWHGNHVDHGPESGRRATHGRDYHPQQKEPWNNRGRGGGHFNTPNYRQSRDWQSQGPGRGVVGREQHHGSRQDSQDSHDPYHGLFRAERKQLFRDDSRDDNNLNSHTDPSDVA